MPIRILARASLAEDPKTQLCIMHSMGKHHPACRRSQLRCKDQSCGAQGREYVEDPTKAVEDAAEGAEEGVDSIAEGLKEGVRGLSQVLLRLPCEGP